MQGQAATSSGIEKVRLFVDMLFRLVVVATIFQLPVPKAGGEVTSPEEDVVYVGGSGPSTSRGVRIETSSNVFVENLQATKKLETNHYVMSLWMTDFFWQRTSGLKINIGLENVSMLPVFNSRRGPPRRSHPDEEGASDDNDDDGGAGDNLFALSDPNAVGDKKHFQFVLDQFCKANVIIYQRHHEHHDSHPRQPIPNFYMLTMEEAKDRLTEAKMKSSVGRTKNGNSGNSYDDDDDDDDDDYDDDYEDERKPYFRRSVNRPCIRTGSYPEPMMAAQNSIVCTSEDAVDHLGRLFGIKRDPVQTVLEVSRSCKEDAVACRRCLDDLSKRPCIGRENTCCQIDCLSTAECVHAASSECQRNEIICAMGTTYRFTLQPIFIDISTSFQCLVSNSRPDLVFRIWFYLEAQELGYETARRWITVRRRTNQPLPKTFSVLFLEVEQDNAGLEEAEQIIITGRKMSPATKSSSSSSLLPTTTSSMAPAAAQNGENRQFSSSSSSSSSSNNNNNFYFKRVGSARPSSHSSTGNSSAPAKDLNLWTFSWKRSYDRKFGRTTSRDWADGDRFRPIKFADNAHLLLASFRRPFDYSTSKWSSRRSGDTDYGRPRRSDCRKDPSRFVPIRMERPDSGWGGKGGEFNSTSGFRRHVTVGRSARWTAADRFTLRSEERSGKMIGPEGDGVIKRSDINGTDQARNNGGDDDDDDDDEVELKASIARKEGGNLLEYTLKSTKNSPSLKFFIPGNSSVLRWWFEGKKIRLVQSSLNLTLNVTSDKKSCEIELRSRLTECPGFVAIVANDWTENEEILRYDLLVACPPELKFVVNFPCQSQGYGSSVVHQNPFMRRQWQISRQTASYHNSTSPIQTSQSSSSDTATPKFHRRSESESAPRGNDQPCQRAIKLDSHVAFEVLVDDGQRIYRRILIFLAFEDAHDGTDDCARKEQDESDEAKFTPAGDDPETTVGAQRDVLILFLLLSFAVLLFFLSDILLHLSSYGRRPIGDATNADDNDDDDDEIAPSLGGSGSRQVQSSRLRPGLIVSSIQSSGSSCNNKNDCPPMTVSDSSEHVHDDGRGKMADRPDAMEFKFKNSPTCSLGHDHPAVAVILSKVILPLFFVVMVTASGHLIGRRFSWPSPGVACFDPPHRSGRGGDAPHGAGEKWRESIVGEEGEAVNSPNGPDRRTPNENHGSFFSRRLNLSEDFHRRGSAHATSGTFSDAAASRGVSRSSGIFDVLPDPVVSLLSFYRPAMPRCKHSKDLNRCASAPFSGDQPPGLSSAWHERLRNFVRPSRSPSANWKKFDKTHRRVSSAARQFADSLEKSKFSLYLNSLYREAQKRFEWSRRNRTLIADWLGLTEEIPSLGTLESKSKKALRSISVESFISRAENRLLLLLLLLQPGRRNDGGEFDAGHSAPAALEIQESLSRLASVRFESAMNHGTYHSSSSSDDDIGKEINSPDCLPLHHQESLQEDGENFNEEACAFKRGLLLLLLVDICALVTRLIRTTCNVKDFFRRVRDKAEAKHLQTRLDSNRSDRAFSGKRSGANLYTPPSHSLSRANEAESQLRSLASKSKGCSPASLTSVKDTSPSSIQQLLRPPNCLSPTPNVSLAEFVVLENASGFASRETTRDYIPSMSAKLSALGDPDSAGNYEKTRGTPSNKLLTRYNRNDYLDGLESFGYEPTTNEMNHDCSQWEFKGVDLLCKMALYALVACILIYQIVIGTDMTADILSAVFEKELASYEVAKTDKTIFEAILKMIIANQIDTFKVGSEFGRILCLETKQRIEGCEQFDKNLYNDIISEISLLVIPTGEKRSSAPLKGMSALVTRREKNWKMLKVEAIFLEHSNFLRPHIYAITTIFIVQCCLEVIDGLCSSMESGTLFRTGTINSNKLTFGHLNNLDNSTAESNSRNVSLNFPSCTCALKNEIKQFAPTLSLPAEKLYFPSSFTETNV